MARVFKDGPGGFEDGKSEFGFCAAVGLGDVDQSALALNDAEELEGDHPLA
jgi:hypothetical protein